MALNLVCDCCGSDQIYSVQRSIDDRWLVQAAPSDLFEVLSEEERRALTQAVKLL